MSTITEKLGLDAQKIGQIAEAHEIYANYLHSQAAKNDKLKLQQAASYYLLSGLYHSLLEPENSIHLFKQATAAYRMARNPFYRITNILSNGPVGERPVIRVKPASTNEVLFYSLIEGLYLSENARAGLNRGQITEKIRSADRYAFLSAEVVADLGVSYGLIVDALYEVYQINVKRKIEIHYLKLLFNQLNNSFNRFRQNSHWRNLLPGTLPYDPIALAIMKIIDQFFIKKDVANDIFWEFAKNPEKDLFFFDLAHKLNALDKRKLQ